MKTSTQNRMTLDEVELTKRAISLIADEDLQYHSKDKNTFTVCQSILISISDNGYRVDFDSKVAMIEDRRMLLNLILIQTSYRKGFYRFKDRCLPLSQIEEQDRKHIARLSKFEMYGLPKNTIYENILFTPNTPQELSQLLDISLVLIKSVRKSNRQAIINSVLFELASDFKESLAA